MPEDQENMLYYLNTQPATRVLLQMRLTVKVSQRKVRIFKHFTPRKVFRSSIGNFNRSRDSFPIQLLVKYLWYYILLVVMQFILLTNIHLLIVATHKNVIREFLNNLSKVTAQNHSCLIIVLFYLSS